MTTGMMKAYGIPTWAIVQAIAKRAERMRDAAERPAPRVRYNDFRPRPHEQCRPDRLSGGRDELAR